ncbi:hypothetical protein D3C78_1143700 [compost metagenome]
MYPRQFEFLNIIGHIRVHLTRQIDKASFRVGIDACGHLVERHFQRIGKRFPAVIQRDATCIMQLFRIGPDRFNGYAHRQRTTRTVSDQTA